jgi:D-xylose transport system permease protein
MVDHVMTAPRPSPPPAQAAGLKNMRNLRTAAVLLLLWAILAVLPQSRETFLTASNLSNITAQVAELTIVSVGMTFIVLTAGIDLSIGASMALYGVVAATLQIDHQLPAGLAILAALGVAVGLGLWHGFLVAFMKVPPFIATLSGFLVYRGAALVLADSRGLAPMRSDFAWLSGRLSGTTSTAICTAGLLVGLGLIYQRQRRRRSFDLPGEAPVVFWGRIATVLAVFLGCLWVFGKSMPVPVLIAASVVALGALTLSSTRLGRYAFAIGGNAEAARLSGIPVTRVKIAVYLLTAVLTAVAAMIAASRGNGVTPGNFAANRELHVITAVVIGGTSLAGGRATMLGTLLGALIFGTLANGMNLLTIDSNWQLIITGLILLGASMLESWSTRSENP